MSLTVLPAPSLAFLKHEIDERDAQRRARFKESETYVGVPAAPPTKWWEESACRDMDMNLFFTVGRPNVQARKACERCTVREPCLIEALAQDIENKYAYGYRAGMGPAERDELRDGTWLERVNRRNLEIREKFVRLHVPTTSARATVIAALAEEYDLTERSVYRLVDDLA